MNLNPILIAQIVNLSNEINMKQSQLNYLIYQAFGKVANGNQFDRFDFSSTRYQHPQHNMPFPPAPSDFAMDPNQFNVHFPFANQHQRTPQQHQWGMYPNPPGKPEAQENQYMPPKEPVPQPKKLDPQPKKPAPEREPADAADFDIIKPVRDMVLSRSFNKGFSMLPVALDYVKKAGVLEVKTKNGSDKFSFIRVRGTYNKPTVQVVVLDTGWNLIESYVYSYTGLVEEGVSGTWMLTKSTSDYKVSKEQIQKEFFKGYPSLMQPLPTK